MRERNEPFLRDPAQPNRNDEEREEEAQDENFEQVAVRSGANESHISVRVDLVEVLPVHRHSHLDRLARIVLWPALDVRRDAHHRRLVDVHAHRRSKVLKVAQNACHVAALARWEC